MGVTVREKHIRAIRRPRSSKPDHDHNAKFGGIELCPNPNSHFHNNNNNWAYCTEEQLQEILLKKLEFLYSEAISKLVALGYDEDVALKAILNNGHCYGAMDVLTNILHNTLNYLNNGNSDRARPGFVDLKQLREFSLAAMVCLLQKKRPHLSKGDVMWCLLMTDINVGQVLLMEIPCIPSYSSCNNGSCSIHAPSNVGNFDNDHPVGVAPALCRFHGGWGFGSEGTSEFPMNSFFPYESEMSLQREIECPKRFNLTPSMKNLLKRNVAAFAAGFRANSKKLHTQANVCSNESLLNGNLSGGVKTGTEALVEENEQLQDAKSQDVVSSVLDKFRDLNLDESIEYVPDDKKDEIVLGLLQQIKDLEKQVKERKDWAHQKAMQAARKLSHDLTELKMLRMEREETQRLKKGKHTLEESTMKRLSEMENALRKASGQMDHANAAVRRLETENAEIRAEMEASKLSASESLTTCVEVAKREKKGSKRLLAWEKQKTRLHDDILAEKQHISHLEAQLVRVEKAKKEAEAKWKEAQKAKDSALTQVEEERRQMETIEASNKMGHEALRLKIEIDFQRHKDGLQRLEQELSRLELSTQATKLNHHLNYLRVDNTDGTQPQRELIARMLDELDNQEDYCSDRKCFVCVKEEVSVVFLPCAHQVLCSNCSENYGKKGRPVCVCPCCRVPIEQRIRVFGAGSS